jgi:diphthine synthase
LITIHERLLSAKEASSIIKERQAAQVIIGDTTLGELVFVGLGLGNRGISLAGVEAMKACDSTYLERYTSPPSPDLVKALEAATGKKISLVGREFVEDGKEILEKASRSSVGLAVQGDPMIATTHNDLRVRAISRGIPTRVIHGTTIPSAAASESGLHYYKFGGTITFTLESASHHQDVYQRVHRNLLEGLHTLILLEYDVEKETGVEPAFVFSRLLDAEKNFKREVLSEGTFAIVLGRVGMKDQEISGGPMRRLKGRSFGPAPHCVIVPGRLHFTEEEALATILKLDKKDVVDNSLTVKRTAQVLVPRYVEKAKKALGEARERLQGRHPELLENAELYLKDSENFLANDQDELAMLSVGYAEGLVDALSFTGEVKLSW